MASPLPVLFGSDSTDPDQLWPFAYLPPELIEMIVAHMWRLDDQLLCRRVCKWWNQRVGMPVRYDPARRPLHRYSLSPTMWATLSTEGRTLRTMRFDPFGSTHLWEYSTDGHRVEREVIFRPPNKVTEIIRDHNLHRRFVTTWNVKGRVAKNEVHQDVIFCSIL